MIASLLFRHSYRRFRAACRRPLDAQARRLRTILHDAARTEFGSRHGFGALARVRDSAAMIAAYQRVVPIRTHRETQEDLDAVYAGDWQRLCPSRPLHFAMTAGSTGRFKYIPMTAEFRRELGQGALIYYGAMEASCPELRRLKAQFLVGSAEGGQSPTGIPQGFASGFNYKHLPRLIRRKFVLPYWIFTLPDAAERAYAAGRILAGNRDLGALCAISPVNLINLKATLNAHAERLIEDVHGGTLSVQCRPAVPGEWRGRPDPRLASALREAWLLRADLPADLLFPSLRLLVCWQGGNMGYYLHELGRSFDRDVYFEFPLSASEGLFAIPHVRNQPGGIAAVTSHFLEFIPEDAASGAETPALRVDQLQAGQCYRLVVTNGGGFYRYDMEDVVRVTSWVERTPVITFVSKRDRQVSVANERITESDVTIAMEAASRASGVWLEEFLFVPCSDRRYRVLIDGSALARLSDPERHRVAGGLAGELEHQLRRAAKGYDFEREDALLAPLALVVTDPGALKAWLLAQQAPVALPNAQVKPMHLTRTFDAHVAFGGATTYAA